MRVQSLMNKTKYRNCELLEFGAGPHTSEYTNEKIVSTLVLLGGKLVRWLFAKMHVSHVGNELSEHRDENNTFKYPGDG